MEDALGWAAAAMLMIRSAIVSVRSSWVSTMGGALAAAQLFSEMAILGVQQP